MLDDVKLKKIIIIDENAPAFITCDIAYFVRQCDYKNVRQRIQILKSTQAKMLKAKTIVYSNLKQECENIYFHKRSFFLKHIEVEFVWVESGGDYYRCYKLEGEIQQYFECFKNYVEIFDIFGNQVIKKEGKQLKSLVYHIQKKFDCKTQAYIDMNTFDGEEANFSAFLEDILGDTG